MYSGLSFKVYQAQDFVETISVHRETRRSSERKICRHRKTEYITLEQKPYGSLKAENSSSGCSQDGFALARLTIETFAFKGYNNNLIALFN